MHSNTDSATTAAAVRRVLAANKSKILGQGPDGTQIDFQTKRTLLNWELLGPANIVPASQSIAVSVLPEAAMSHRRTIQVVAAVIERDGAFLACRRRPGKAAGGKWEFPGGKLEPGERSSEALVREIQEELGVAIDVIGPLRTDDTIVGDNVIRLTCLFARLVGEAPTRSVDHDELRWVVRAELPDLEWATPDLPAVAQLASADINR